MSDYVMLLSVPGLRAKDISSMPNLAALVAKGSMATLAPSFPCVTLPVQANMTTGVLPDEHGVVANGYYWRERDEIEMWTAWNDTVLAPQIWDVLHEKAPGTASAVWFPMFAKGCGADYIATPAPVHNPDGSESLWCYTKPTELYGELRDSLGHFPLQNFWGPLANINSSQWIADSAVHTAKQFHPHFFYIYLTHLDYAPQKFGPDSDQARRALAELDELLGKLIAQINDSYEKSVKALPLWLIASEYVITPVTHVTFPNRILRDAGLLAVSGEGREKGELLETARSQAWSLVDHQFSHVFVRDRDAATIERVVELFRGKEGIDEVLVGEERQQYHLDHGRAGDVILISAPNSWQAYYYWEDDSRAPSFARTVDIHRKPGYDPVEMHFDPHTRGIPLDASLVKGSHGAPARHEDQRGIIVASQPGVFATSSFADTDVADLVVRQFGV